jgi:hypothetical protein
MWERESMRELRVDVGAASRCVSCELMWELRVDVGAASRCVSCELMWELELMWGPIFDERAANGSSMQEPRKAGPEISTHF